MAFLAPPRALPRRYASPRVRITRAKISEYAEPHFSISSTTPPRLLCTIATRIQPFQTDYSSSLHHSQYIPLLERARVECLAALGLNYSDLVAKENTELVVVDLNVRYRQPAKMGDIVQIHSTVAEGKSPIRMSVESWFRLENRTLATARVDLACVDATTGKLKKRPRMIVDFFESVNKKFQELMEIGTADENGEATLDMKHQIHVGS